MRTISIFPSFFQTKYKPDLMEALMEAVGWRKSLSDFSEIDTSDIATDLSDLPLPGFDDIKEIIADESSLVNTDYMNQNLLQRKTEDTNPLMFVTITGDLASEVEISTSVDQHNTKKTKAVKKKVRKAVSGFSCVVCKKVFKDKKEMKHHVLKTHLRPVVFCSECGKGVFKDKILQHKKSSCSVQVKH